MESSAAAKAYNYLVESILSGEIALGAPIYESEISELLGSSRSPVREALKKLEAEELVNYYPGKGTFVIQITSQDVAEIFDLRIILEVAALQKSFRYINQDHLLEIEKEIKNLDSAHVTPEKFYSADKQLHGLFMNHCGNKRLLSFYNRLMLQFDIVRRISGKDPMHFPTSQSYHLKIIDALKEQNLEKAVTLLTQHLEEVKTRTIRQYVYAQV